MFHYTTPNITQTCAVPLIVIQGIEVKLIFIKDNLVTAYYPEMIVYQS